MTQTTVESQIAEADPKALVSLQNQAYNAAWSRIRQKYRDEYDAAVDEEFAKRGLERRKRRTSEQRAEQQEQEKKAKAQQRFDRLLAEHPELKDYVKKAIA